MPRPIGVIQKPGLFEDILSRVGVNRPQQPFVLDGDVVPVILVDSAVSFVASPTPPYGVTDISTAGLLVAPAAGTVLADTGPLPVGAYSVQVFVQANEQNGFDFQWRDAPNAANLWTQILGNGPVGTTQTLIYEVRLNIANVNERFRVLNVTAGGVGIPYQASILAKL